jgi:hypothetical protein
VTRLLTEEEEEMQIHGLDLQHTWRIAFWVVLILAALASAVLAIVS